MTKSILAAVDLSEKDPDPRVLTTAARLARFEGARLDVVTVVPDMGTGQVTSFFPPDFEEKAVAAARTALNAFCARVLGEEANAAIRHEVAVGRVYHEVLHVAEKAGSDLIVVGSHKPAARDYLLGTNAARIVRHASCSVYVVR